jgi:hypothetical protein
MTAATQAGWEHTRPARLRLAGLAARTTAHVLYDRVAVRRVRAPGTVPPRIGALTPEWLTAALCPAPGRARVRGFTVDRSSSGTSVRGRLRLDYDGDAGGLPATVFAKSTPSVLTRLANGATGTSAAEAAFFAQLRPLLGDELQIPFAHRSAFDPRSFRSIHLLEDLAATRQATFGTPDLRLDLDQARAAVDLLAALHRRFAAEPRPTWMLTYRQWWTAAMRVADIQAPTEALFDEPWCPEPLRARRAEVWPAFVRSVALHDTLPATVLHADVHIGNWYLSGDGAPGLCDWQCVGHGHWSLDVAYALTTLLPVEDRRAWERELLARYLDRAGAPESEDEAWLRYRQQIPGALLKWTPALNPPRGLPQMQPRPVATELLQRITAAMVDHDVLDLLRR